MQDCRRPMEDAQADLRALGALRLLERAAADVDAGLGILDHEHVGGLGARGAGGGEGSGGEFGQILRHRVPLPSGEPRR